MITPICAIATSSVVADAFSLIMHPFFSLIYGRNFSSLEWGNLRLTIGLAGFLVGCVGCVANEILNEDKNGRNLIRKIVILPTLVNPISLYCISRAAQTVFGKYLN